MIRLVFAGLAAVACVLLGWEEARRLLSRVERLKAWIRALELVDLRLVHDGIPLREAVLQEGEGEPARRLKEFSGALAANPRLSAREAWEASGKSQEAPEDKLLAECFAALGTGVLEKRRTAISQAAEQLKALLEEAQAKAARDCKLYRSMGLCGGVALLLILL